MHHFDDNHCILCCACHIIISLQYVRTLSYKELSCGKMIVFCPPAVSPHPLRTLELIVCPICKYIMAQKNNNISRRWCDFFFGGGGGEEGGKAAVEWAIFSTPILLKIITHCRVRVRWERQTNVCKNLLSWFSPTRVCSVWCWNSSQSLSVLVCRCLIIKSNNIYMLITPVYRRKRIFIKNGHYHEQNVSVFWLYYRFKNYIKATG